MTKPVIYFNSSVKEWEFLSNFYLSPLWSDDLREWDSSEHAYQAVKTEDIAAQEMIRLCGHPRESKKLGRSVVLRPNWDPLRFMKNILKRKFTHNTDLYCRLLATSPADLVEYAPWGDDYWGVDKNYQGHNNLGKLLVEWRETWLDDPAATVCNLSHQGHLQNKHGLTQDDFYYVGRLKNQPYHFGNPYSHTVFRFGEIIKVGTRLEAVQNFEDWLLDDADDRAKWINDNISALRGKHLSCYCWPQLCHGVVLAKLANKR